MKSILFILIVSFVLIGSVVADNFLDNNLAQKSEVILHVKLLTVGGADKYAWYEVEILEVLKNESKETFTKKLKIAAYSWKPGIPEGESTVYLERYNKITQQLWMLLGGEASTGVRQALKPAEVRPTQ
ncbi:MAG: hypothetical protein V4507_13540 [Verrucomicrobiota bacterium]